MSVRAYLFLSAGFLCSALILASTGEATQATASPNTESSRGKKVVTNEDLQPQPSELAITTSARSAQLDSAASEGEQRLAGRPDKASIAIEEYVKDADAHSYLEQMNSLRTELEGIDTKVQQLREFRRSALGATGGITLDQPSLRLSPENELEQLALRRQEVARQIGELEDMARHKGFPAGFLRGSLPSGAPAAMAVGPEEKQALSPDQQRAAWQEKLRPLQEELAQAQGTVERMYKEAAAQGMTLSTGTVGGNPTTDLLRRLEARAGALQQQISAIEEEARQASVPPGWLR